MYAILDNPIIRTAISCWLIAQPALAQGDGDDSIRRTTFEQLPAVVLANDVLELTVAEHGGAFVSLHMRDDPEMLSPLWNPARAAREAGDQPRPGASRGHFVCVDGFGRPSPEERAAGLPGHGEAHVLPWKLLSARRDGGVVTVNFAVELPVVQEVFTRAIRLVDGESVIYVHSELESLLGFDRPICWTEHATIGSPFLEPLKTVVDVPASRAMTRPYAAAARGNRRLASAKEFTWPNAPAVAGGEIDLRAAPATFGHGDIVTVLLDSQRDVVYATALHTGRHLLFGYVFRSSDYPWFQDWQSYPKAETLARGLEFGSQPFGVGRRETVQAHSLLGAPTYRWLPAKSKIKTSFLMFYTRTPANFRQVHDVRLEKGNLIVEDHSTGERVTLSASLGLWSR